MRRRGYAETGVHEVLGAASAPKGSLYHHFPGGKEELAAATIEAAGRVVGERIEEAFAAGEDMAATVRWFARLLARNLERSGYRDGCPVATVALEESSESEPIHEACAGAFLAWREAIADRLREDGLDPEQATRTAVLLLSAFEGALIMARVLRDPSPLHHQVADELARGLPGDGYGGWR